MSVERFDSPLRFMVDSGTTKGHRYLVELDAYHGNGRCACHHFQMRFEPLVKERQPGGETLRCKHLKEARQFLCDELIQKVIAARPHRRE